MHNSSNVIPLVANRALAVLYSFLTAYCHPGQKFVLPVNLCPSVYWCFAKAGIQVFFCDIERESLCLDLGLAQSIFRKNKCSGILFNHTYGCSFYPKNDLISFQEANDECIIINDSCLCQPKIHHRCSDYSPSDLTLYSTGYAKHVDLGYGGYGYFSSRALTTGLVNIDFHPDELAFLDRENKSGHAIYDYQMRDLCWLDTSCSFKQESYFKAIRKELPIVNSHKSECNSVYYSILSDIDFLNSDYNNWRFNILTDNKDLILNSIRHNDLFASSHYRLLEENQSSFPVASQLHSKVINLFNDRYFTPVKAARISEIILDSYR